VGEKVANFVFNAGRSSKMQRWGEERVGLGDGEVKRVDREREGVEIEGQGEGEGQHGVAREVGVVGGGSEGRRSGGEGDGVIR
jgi:hypothetical protein